MNFGFVLKSLYRSGHNSEFHFLYLAIDTHRHRDGGGGHCCKNLSFDYDSYRSTENAGMYVDMVEVD